MSAFLLVISLAALVIVCVALVVVMRTGGQLRVHAVELENAAESARTRARELETKIAHADRLTSLGQMVAGVAHEINNPAAVVMGNLEILLRRGDGLPPEDRRRILEQSLGAIRRIGSMSQGLRRFVGTEEHRLELVQLNEIAEAAIELTANEIRHRARLVRDFVDTPLVYGDPSRLSQVVTNLLVDAAHAIEPGGAEHNEIRVSTRFLDGRVVLAVEDTGLLLPPELRKGLGLSIAEDIVRDHGGEIRVSARPDRGTRLEMILPARAEIGVAVPPEAPAKAAPPPPGRLRILAVDDEPLILNLYRNLLEPRNEVVTAQSGGAALEILERDESFDAILCDLMMPDIDGPTFYEGLPARAPQLKKRLVFMTGGAFSKRSEAFLRETPVRLVRKPFNPSDLEAALADVARA